MPATPIPILKKEPQFEASRGNPAKKVVFAPSVQLLVEGICDQHGALDYQKEFSYLKEETSSVVLCQWLQQMTDHVNLLDRRVNEMIQDFLKLPWFEKDCEVAKALKSFLICLVSAHSYHIYQVLAMLFENLVPYVEVSDADELRQNAGKVSPEKEEIYKCILETVVGIYNRIPMCEMTILRAARTKLPYFRRHVHMHAVYTHNLLLLSFRLPQMRLKLLEIVITNMVTVDVHAPKVELAAEDESDDDESSGEGGMFEMDIDEGKDKRRLATNAAAAGSVMRHPEGHTLDVLMNLMLLYLHCIAHGFKDIPRDRKLHEIWRSIQCYPGVAKCEGVNTVSCGCECGGVRHDVTLLKEVFSDMRDIFVRIILPTHSSHHTQFLLFYLFAIRPGLAKVFLENLRTSMFESPTCGRDTRRNAMAYIGSLLARGRFIPFIQVHSCLEVICNWCHSYIDQQERNGKLRSDLAIHAPFYYACQTVFYVFTFRYKDYVDSKKRMELAQSLNLEHLVLSHLNPLRVCSPAVVTNFAAVTRHYQLAYCYTIIENNKRMTIPVAEDADEFEVTQTTLDMLFPFDPYLLKSSRKFISCHYLEFDGLPEVMDVDNDGDDAEEDDFLDHSASSLSRSAGFSYETSPGYRKC